MIETPEAATAAEPDDLAEEVRALVEDPLRERLGWLGRKLPATQQGLQARAVLDVARRLSIAKTLYWSLRFRGRCLVARGTKVSAQRTSRVEFGPDGWLLLGLHHNGPNRTLLDLGRDARLVVNGTVQAWRGAQIKVFAGGCLEFRGRWISNEDSKMICYKSIRTGDGGGVSWNATVMDSDLHPFYINGRWQEKDAPVVLGDRAFIGSHAIVLKGVTLGEGTVVAAGSVVTKDQPAHCIVAGNPARVVHENVDWV